VQRLRVKNSALKTELDDMSKSVAQVPEVVSAGSRTNAQPAQNSMPSDSMSSGTNIPVTSPGSVHDSPATSVDNAGRANDGDEDQRPDDNIGLFRDDSGQHDIGHEDLAGQEPEPTAEGEEAIENTGRGQPSPPVDLGSRKRPALTASSSTNANKKRKLKASDDAEMNELLQAAKSLPVFVLTPDANNQFAEHALSTVRRKLPVRSHSRQKPVANVGWPNPQERDDPR
jgi:hypothetical protein